MRLICNICQHSTTAPDVYEGKRCNEQIAIDAGGERRCGGHYIDVERDRDFEKRGQLNALETSQIDRGILAAWASLEVTAHSEGGEYVGVRCTCGAETYGTVVNGEVVGYARSCNCDESRALTEAKLLAAATPALRRTA